ncbi:fibronectin type III domain-containing protein, partial [Dyadobacter sp. CY323]|uniref:fibronectin type III domain-containing protein n=1 Tax=Dyadobacter sp. CY323 TaxID=2907302 RepID=UPI001F25D0F5
MKRLNKLFIRLIWCSVVSIHSALAAVPATPKNFSANASSSSQINLKWAEASGLGSYELHRSTDNKAFAKIADPDSKSTSYEDKSLKANTTYYYKLYAANKDGKSAAAEAGAKTNPAQVLLKAPSNMEAAATSPSEIKVTWVNNDFYTKIELRYSKNSNQADGATLSLGSNETQKSLTGLDPDTKYYITLQGFLEVEGINDKTIVVGADATTQNPTPATPSGLEVTGTDEKTINVKWNAVDGAAGYQVQISDVSDFSKGVQTAETDSKSGSYQFGNLTSGKTYWIQVRAKNVFNKKDYFSGWSKSVSGTTAVPLPNAPTNLVLSPQPDGTKIHVSWKDNADNETGFDLEYSKDGGYAGATSVNLGSNAATFQIEGLEKCNTYYVRVAAKNGAGRSGWITGKTDVRPSVPPKPSAFGGNVASSTQINLNWSYSAGTEDGFELEYADNGNYNNSQKRDLSKDRRDENVTGLQSNAVYFFRLKAKNCAGDAGWIEYKGQTTAAKPSAPTYDLEVLSSTEIKIKYQNTAGPNATSLELQYARNEAFSEGLGTKNLPIAGNSETIGGLLASTKYFFRLRAANSTTITSSDWVIKDATTPAAPIAKPAKPTNLSATPTSSSQINLAWTDASNNE